MVQCLYAVPRFIEVKIPHPTSSSDNFMKNTTSILLLSAKEFITKMKYQGSRKGRIKWFIFICTLPSYFNFEIVIVFVYIQVKNIHLFSTKVNKTGTLYSSVENASRVS